MVYRDLTLESSAIDMLTNSSTKIQITSGNGDYRIESLDKNLDISLETDEKGISYVIINSNENELIEAVVTVYDRTMRSTNIKVNVKDPYTMIKDDATQRVQYKAYIKTVGTAGITFFNDIERNPSYRTFGWSEGYEREFEIRIPTSVDLKVVGKKAGAQIKYDLYGYGDRDYTYNWLAIDPDPGLEVIKYDQSTGLVWIVFYYTKSGNTSQGIVCMKI